MFSYIAAAPLFPVCRFSYLLSSSSQKAKMCSDWSAGLVCCDWSNTACVWEMSQFIL